MSAPLLTVRGLRVRFPEQDPVVDGVDLEIRKAETLALVGESGSGKSLTGLALMGLAPPSARVESEAAEFAGEPLFGDEMMQRRLRGGRIGIIFQEPMSCLNPLQRVGEQVAEAVRIHQRLSGQAARQRVLGLFSEVGLDQPERRYRAYPHQLSGGQQQRVMIAMALAGDPRLLIADEPTTALDVTVQAQILELLQALQRQRGMAMLFISHDLPVVAGLARRVAVMRRGQILETGETGAVFARPAHPYTRELLAARPAPGNGASPGGDDSLVTVRGLAVVYGDGWRRFQAVDGVDFQLRRGRTLGLVGESGSGKSTVARALCGLVPVAGGDIRLFGEDPGALPLARLRPLRRRCQLLFQNAGGALNPRLRVRDSLREVLHLHGLRERDTPERLVAAMAEVDLPAPLLTRYPHQLSGGQRQRVVIARALLLDPEVLILDESLSALDRSVQARLLTLLRELQLRRALAMLFISHDLSLVSAIAHEVLVMQAGRVVERGTVGRVFGAPEHAHTRALRAALPGGLAVPA